MINHCHGATGQAHSASSEAIMRRSSEKPTKPASKPGAAKPVTSQSKAPVAPADPRIMAAPEAVVLGPVLRKKELIEAVVERSGIKKKDAKPVIEAMLAVMGTALAQNREVNLPDLGRIKIRREKQLANGRMMVAKIRQPVAAKDKNPSNAEQ
jgi:nucleoid DNA-binding protein